MEKSFTLVVINGQMPQVTIDHKKFAVVTCSYTWETSTGEHIHNPVAVVSGYLEGERELKVYKLYFYTNTLIEF